jgi:hypothetical protein
MPAINNPTINMIRHWKKDELAKWIQQKLVVPLESEDEEKLLNANIDGEAFLSLGGDRMFFIQDVGLSPGAGQKLGNLAMETISQNRECCRSTSYTLRRQASLST